MNKREKAALAAAELASRVHRALRWSLPAHWREYKQDLPSPQYGDQGYVLGWSLNLHRILSGYGGGLDSSSAVYPSWSGTSSHGTGHEHPGKHGSQRGVAQYSTKMRALRALRCELEQWAGERLEQIDRLIEAERAKEAEVAG
jgi:hypothetical protein